MLVLLMKYEQLRLFLFCLFLSFWGVCFFPRVCFFPPHSHIYDLCKVYNSQAPYLHFKQLTKDILTSRAPYWMQLHIAQLLLWPKSVSFPLPIVVHTKNIIP